jgi:hypothetical protein
MRRQDWSDARRLLLLQSSLPPELKSVVDEFVDALADPARRPAVVARMQQIDPKVATQADLIQPYLQLGQFDLVLRIMEQSLDRDRMAWADDWELMQFWSPGAAALRADPRFSRLVERAGLVDYWKQYGYPDDCRAGEGDRALVCDP